MREHQEQRESEQRAVLVVGGGVGGIQTALDLAEAGHPVVMVDRHPAIGGLVTQLDRTFPTNNCDLCTLSPHLSEGHRQERIQVLEMTRVETAEGEAGDFRVTLRSDPRHIDLERCTACGECLTRYPECVRFTPGLDHRAPTCMRYPQATPHAFSIDMERCSDVEGLVACCPAGAILPEEAPRTDTISCSAIVLATGAEVHSPGPANFFGYGSDPDVITSLEYERILSASGPTQGQLVRPSDGKQPEKIAWIQCVGSRGLRPGSVSYCSSACCMITLKETLVTKERFQDDIDATVFFMDMRTSGKDYERFYDQARNEAGVRFIRCRPENAVRREQSQRLAIRYFEFDASEAQEEEFDLVVLGTGFRVDAETRALAECLGVDQDLHGFVKTSDFHPVSTSRAGIYVCGVAEGPKDIPETLSQASAAACMAASHLPLQEEVPTEAESLLPERDVRDEPPRLGVFVCDCGYEIGSVIDVPAVTAYAGSLPDVMHAEPVGYGCSRESIAHIQEVIQREGLNRVVIGGCSPRTHEQKFQDAIRGAGLNRYLVEIANLRDQNTWVHRKDPAAAESKARDLLRMAVASARLSQPLREQVLTMNRDVLVVGGGVAGMSAALALADRGIQVHLVESSDHLGGLAPDVRHTLEGGDARAFAQDLVARTEAHDRIQVLTDAIVVDHSGVPGRFSTGIQMGRQAFYRSIEHGATVLATGARTRRPDVFLLGQNPAVMTQMDLEQALDDPEHAKDWKDVLMIQCAGSRTPEYPVCSRICCQNAVKNALALLDRNPDLRILVLYRDMRMPGVSEDAYREARHRGVVFIRYEPERPPEVTAEEGKLQVRFMEPLLGEELQFAPDALCLSTGMEVDEESTEDIATIFRLPRTDAGFFLEDHVKLRPVDLPVPGFFVAGTAHCPKSIAESVTQAKAVAARVEALLARRVIQLGAGVARVDSDRCAACLVCVRACPFGVPEINADGYSEIDPARCHGCGVCAAECPARAIQLQQFTDDRLSAKLDSLLERMTA